MVSKFILRNWRKEKRAQKRKLFFYNSDQTIFLPSLNERQSEVIAYRKLSHSLPWLTKPPGRAPDSYNSIVSETRVEIIMLITVRGPFSSSPLCFNNLSYLSPKTSPRLNGSVYKPRFSVLRKPNSITSWKLGVLSNRYAISFAPLI